MSDDKNLESSVLFGVTINRDGRVTDFQDLMSVHLYYPIKLVSHPSEEEVKRHMVYVMGNDLGDTLYTMCLEHKRYISEKVEFELTVSGAEKLSYIQEPADQSWQIGDEDDTQLLRTVL
jgi:hypothetical protein